MAASYEGSYEGSCFQVQVLSSFYAHLPPILKIFFRWLAKSKLLR